MDVRIVDSDGRDVRSGATGELHVRGPNVMAGYWRRPDATRDVLLDGGWLRTGDAARMDADGYIWIVDRFADRFETAAGVVFPGDVERVLLSNQAVVDAGVVGVPSPDGGDVGAAFVVLAPGASTTTERSSTAPDASSRRMPFPPRSGRSKTPTEQRRQAPASAAPRRLTHGLGSFAGNVSRVRQTRVIPCEGAGDRRPTEG